ncbi:MauE/DoxX family redox-associated membrane protein [Streptomyces sp. NPDC000229]|uniref:MauE/DoxX family redox-associated membrane protein n=1 Tax=Streptomyces sp. NPDC000229 TaxID=3154247 RepID=UPI0033226525
MQYAEIGMRCLIGTVFMAAAVSKLAGRRSFAAFAGSVAELNVLPPALTRWAAIAVVCGECLVCLLLLVPAAPAAVLGFTGAAVLLCLFAVVIGRVVAAGARTACRCFGASTVPLGVRHIVRNVVLACLAAAGVVAAQATGPVHPAGLVVAALSGLLAGGLVVGLDTVVDLFQPVRSKA